MNIKLLCAGAAAVSMLAFALPAAAVTIVPAKCASVTAAAGCFFLGNIGNASDTADAQSQYNALRNPDIVLNFLGKSDGGFGVTTLGNASESFGTWSTPGFLVDFIAVKAGTEFVLYQLAAPASSGSWSTAGLVNGKNTMRELSHLTFFGAAGAVPEPATWGMMLLGFGIVGATVRRRQRRLAIV